MTDDKIATMLAHTGIECTPELISEVIQRGVRAVEWELHRDRATEHLIRFAKAVHDFTGPVGFSDGSPSAFPEIEELHRQASALLVTDDPRKSTLDRLLETAHRRAGLWVDFSKGFVVQHCRRCPQHKLVLHSDGYLLRWYLSDVALPAAGYSPREARSAYLSMYKPMSDGLFCDHLDMGIKLVEAWNPPDSPGGDEVIVGSIIDGLRDEMPEGHKGGFVLCKCGAGAFVDGGPDLDLSIWECKQCQDKQLGLRVPSYEEAAPLLQIPEVSDLREWRSDGERWLLTVVPAGNKRGMIRALSKIDWKAAGFRRPRIGPREEVAELVWE